MKVLLLTSHAIAEYDDLRMLTDLGYDTFSIGGAYDETPFEGKRPALDVPTYPELVDATNRQRAEVTEERGDPGPYIDWGKAWLHPDVIEWADVIIVHHFPERWIADQWDRIRHKRVIWRTCGQSSPDGSLERQMAELDGLQIVRYSPRERVIPGFAGEDALIRFGKYPADYGPWTGEWPGVINITQHMAQRGDACGYGVWQEVTRGLARPFEDGPPPPFALPLGPGSEAIGGTGALTYDEMRGWLNRARAYFYTGTHPASYTLGLIEAMLSGIPVITVPWQTGWQALDDLYEASPRYVSEDGQPMLIPGIVAADASFADTQDARRALQVLFDCPDKAATVSANQRQRAIDLFGIDTVGPQWQAFLG